MDVIREDSKLRQLKTQNDQLERENQKLFMQVRDLQQDLTSKNT